MKTRFMSFFRFRRCSGSFLIFCFGPYWWQSGHKLSSISKQAFRSDQIFHIWGDNFVVLMKVCIPLYSEIKSNIFTQSMATSKKYFNWFEQADIWMAARSGSSFSFFVIINLKKIRTECIFWGKRNFLRKTRAEWKSHFRQNQKDKGRP